MTTSNQTNPLTVAVFVDNYLETYTNEQNKLRSRGTTGMMTINATLYGRHAVISSQADAAFRAPEENQK